MNSLYQILIAPVEHAMEVVMAGLYTVTGSYGVSIFLLSLIINIVLLPLFQLAERWQEAERRMQQILKPKLKQYREAFSGEERQAMIQTLYRQAGYHPIYAMRSSLGLFLQLPFWIAAYQFLAHYQPLNGASFLIFEDLGRPDGLIGGINVLPFIMTALNLTGAVFYTRRLSMTDQIQPLVLASAFLLLLYSAPAGLLLYWTFNSLFSVLRINFIDSRHWNARVTEAQKPAAAETLTFLCRPFVTTIFGPVLLRREPGKATSSYSSASISHRTVSFRYQLVLFALAALSQIAVRLDTFASPSNVGKITLLVINGTSILILIYLACMSTFGNPQKSNGDARRGLTNALIWTLLVALFSVNLAWIFNIYPQIPHAKLVVGILGLQGFLFFASPLSNSIPATRKMSSSHGLFAVALGLTAYIVFVANPIALYASSNDFTTEVYTVLPTFLLYCCIAVTLLVLFYALVDAPSRKLLTLLTVFLAAVTVAYTAIGIQYAGKMLAFALPVPSVLARNPSQIALELLALLCVFAGITMATIFSRHHVQRVLVTVLIAVLCVSALDVYKSYRLLAGSGTFASPESSNSSGILSFSRERNVVIIMLDGFPGGYFHKIRSEMPEVLSEYEGFTWYPNTLAAGMETFSSIAAVAGGPKYTVGEINRRSYESVSHAFIEAYQLLIKNFSPKGYSVSYVNPVYGGCAPLDKRADCTTAAPFGVRYRNNEGKDKPYFEGESHIPRMLTMVSVLQAVPFFLKDYVYDHGDYLGVYSQLRSRVFNSYKAPEWGVLRELGSVSTADNPSKAFKFFQVSIPHNPNALNGECQLEPTRATVLSESVCSLKEIGNFLAWLKKNIIYDVTKLIIVSDHGWSIDNPLFPPNFEAVVPREISWGPIPGLAQPLLLVKDFFESGKVVTSNTFLSNSDVASIACSAIGGCEGIDDDPTENPTEGRVLTHSRVRWSPEQEKAPRFDIYDIYEVRDSIFDPTNWKKVTFPDRIDSPALASPLDEAHVRHNEPPTR